MSVSPTTFSRESALSYPGQTAKFELTSGLWKLNPLHKIPREMVFTPDSSDALFSQIRVLGFRNGNVGIDATLKAPITDEITTYFEPYIEGVLMKSDAAILYATDHHVSKLFQVLVANNPFEPEYLEVLEELIEEKDWRKVTPLPLGETLPTMRARW